MFAVLGTGATVGMSETLGYAPPAGSTLAGGQLSVSGYTGGYGFDASAIDTVNSPGDVYPNDTKWACSSYGPGSTSQVACGSFANTEITLPANAGGGVYLSASCGGSAGQTCDQGASGTTTASANLNSALLLLSNSSIPAGANFTGTALAGDDTGTTQLIFTASDPGGPGVYTVHVSLDGAAIYAATPDTNSGQCVAHGTYPGTNALEFDFAQPCPQAESVDVPVNVAALKNGKHELTATVTDAANNTATVLDQTITVLNPTTTPTHITPPAKKKALHVKVDFLWVWRGERTTLNKLTFHRLPRNSTVRIACTGHNCPRGLGTTSRKLLLKTLEGRIYRHTVLSGNTLTFTIAHKGETSERIRATMRNGKAPTLKLL